MLNIDEKTICSRLFDVNLSSALSNTLYFCNNNVGTKCIDKAGFEILILLEI